MRFLILIGGVAVYMLDDKEELNRYWENYSCSDFFGNNVKKFAQLWMFEPQDYIVKEDMEVENLNLLIKGRAKLYYSHPNGKVSLIDFIIAPSLIGEMELASTRSSKAVQAITPCLCISLPFDKTKELLFENKTFLKLLCAFLGQKSFNQLMKSIQNKTFSLKSRLAQYILTASTNGVYREKHTETSEYLGVTYRHLLYVFSEFKKDGLLRKTKTGYLITDKKQLKLLSKDILDTYPHVLFPPEID